MTRISQCRRCRIRKGIRCEHYRPTDDDACPHFRLGMDDDKESTLSIRWKFFYFLYAFVLWLLSLRYGIRVFLYGVVLFLLVGGLWMVARLCVQAVRFRPQRRLLSRIEKILDTISYRGCADRSGTGLCFRYRDAVFFIEVTDDRHAVLYDLNWLVLPADASRIDRLSSLSVDALLSAPTSLKVDCSVLDEGHTCTLTTRCDIPLSGNQKEDEESFRSLTSDMLAVREAVKRLLEGVEDEIQLSFRHPDK